MNITYETGKDGVERKKINTLVTREAFGVIQETMDKFGVSMGQAINIICLEKKRENEIISNLNTMTELLKNAPDIEKK